MSQPCAWMMLLLLSAGAGRLEAAKVGTEHDPRADFASFHTFAWRVTEGPAAPDLDLQLRATAETELAERGLRRAGAGEAPDLLLEYNLGWADQLTAGFAVTVDWWGGLAAVPAAESQVTAGLVFLLTRPQGREPVWTGWLVQRGTNENALLVMRQRISKLARKILSRYPPS